MKNIFKFLKRASKDEMTAHGKISLEKNICGYFMILAIFFHVVGILMWFILNKFNIYSLFTIISFIFLTVSLIVADGRRTRKLLYKHFENYDADKKDQKWFKED